MIRRGSRSRRLGPFGLWPTPWAPTAGRSSPRRARSTKAVSRWSAYQPGRSSWRATRIRWPYGPRRSRTPFPTPRCAPCTETTSARSRIPALRGRSWTSWRERGSARPAAVPVEVLTRRVLQVALALSGHPDTDEEVGQEDCEARADDARPAQDICFASEGHHPEARDHDHGG